MKGIIENLNNNNNRKFNNNNRKFKRTLVTILLMIQVIKRDLKQNVYFSTCLTIRN